MSKAKYVPINEHVDKEEKNDNTYNIYDILKIILFYLFVTIVISVICFYFPISLALNTNFFGEITIGNNITLKNRIGAVHVNETISKVEFSHINFLNNYFLNNTLISKECPRLSAFLSVKNNIIDPSSRGFKIEVCQNNTLIDSFVIYDNNTIVIDYLIVKNVEIENKLKFFNSTMSISGDLKVNGSQIIIGDPVILKAVNVENGDTGFLIKTTSKNKFVDSFYINPDGWIGIGTLNPKSNLDIVGNVTNNGTFTAYNFYILGKLIINGTDLIDFIKINIGTNYTITNFNANVFNSTTITSNNAIIQTLDINQVFNNYGTSNFYGPSTFNSNVFFLNDTFFNSIYTNNISITNNVNIGGNLLVFGKSIFFDDITSNGSLTCKNIYLDNLYTNLINNTGNSYFNNANFLNQNTTGVANFNIINSNTCNFQSLTVIESTNLGSLNVHLSSNFIGPANFFSDINVQGNITVSNDANLNNRLYVNKKSYFNDNIYAINLYGNELYFNYIQSKNISSDYIQSTNLSSDNIVSKLATIPIINSELIRTIDFISTGQLNTSNLQVNGNLSLSENTFNDLISKIKPILDNFTSTTINTVDINVSGTATIQNINAFTLNSMESIYTNNFYCNITNSTIINAYIVNTDTLNSNLINTDILRSNTLNSNIINTYFINTNISNSSVVNTDIINTNILNSITINVYFINTTNLNSTIINTFIINTNTLNSILINTEIINTNTLNSDVINTNITNTNTLNSTIISTYFINSNISNSSVINTDIINANTLNVNILIASDLYSNNGNYNNLTTNFLNSNNLNCILSNIQTINSNYINTTDLEVTGNLYLRQLNIGGPVIFANLNVTDTLVVNNKIIVNNNIYVDQTAFISNGIVADGNIYLSGPLFSSNDAVFFGKRMTANEIVTQDAGVIFSGITTYGVQVPRITTMLRPHGRSDILDNFYVDIAHGDAQSNGHIFAGTFACGVAPPSDFSGNVCMYIGDGGIFGFDFSSFGSFTVISSQIVKENITNITTSDAYDRLLNIQITSYNFKKDYQKVSGKDNAVYIGPIAEQIEPFYPTAVTYKEIDISGTKRSVPTIDYNPLVSDLVKIVQDLTARVAELERILQLNNIS